MQFSPLVNGDDRLVNGGSGREAPHSVRYYEAASEAPPRAARAPRGFAAGVLGSCSPARRQSGTNVAVRARAVGVHDLISAFGPRCEDACWGEQRRRWTKLQEAP